MRMNITGIISEYNPFHNGHRYHIEQTRRIRPCDVLINVMSGNFVQRGEPAIIDKWKRAKEAIQQGCDLVIELPYPFVVQRSDYFAYGAIETLKLAGIDHLVFGSESNDIELLKTYAKTPFSLYKEHQLQGISMAKAMENVHMHMSSNDILGIAYIKALRNSNIIPYTIQRTNNYHDLSVQSTIASASAIRVALQQNISITHVTPMADQIVEPLYLENYYPYLQTVLTTIDKKELRSFFLVDEGIESLLIKQALLHNQFDHFLTSCISKRYTRSSIQRTLIHILTRTKKEEINQLPKLKHMRILAFNTIGKQHLHFLKKKTNVIIASRFNQIPEPFRSMEIRSTNAYSYPFSLEKRKEVRDSELQPPIYVSNSR